MRTVDRPLTPLDVVWSDLLGGLMWFVDRFGGLTAMLARETVFTTLRVMARKKLRDLESMVRALLVMAAADLRLKPPERKARREQATCLQTTRVQPGAIASVDPRGDPRNDPQHPERWRATFPAPRRFVFSLGGEPAGDLDFTHSFAPIDLAPMARRLEAIRRVLADLPGHARRWARYLPEIFFARRAEPRTRAAREALDHDSRMAAREHAEHALFKWKDWRRVDTS